MVTLAEIAAYAEGLLEVRRFKDYCPNGIHVEGRRPVRRVLSGVTASLALIEEAIARDADALLVHHGYFWRNEAPVVTGMKHAACAVCSRAASVCSPTICRSTPIPRSATTRNWRDAWGCA